MNEHLKLTIEDLLTRYSITDVLAAVSANLDIASWRAGVRKDYDSRFAFDLQAEAVDGARVKIELQKAGEVQPQREEAEASNVLY